MTLKKGDKCPHIELSDQFGKTRSSKEIKGKKLVLFFYPKDNTPGCTAEACAFRDNYDYFKKCGAEVWGVSSDDINSHISFASKYKLSFSLLSDKDNKLRKLFGVPSPLGLLPGRVTYIIDSNGIIIDIYKDLLNGPIHVQNAMNILKNIK
tara:strand:- start:27 stop:479 length:453 start_codon:yes stop_codon:yes gene_type:complete